MSKKDKIITSLVLTCVSLVLYIIHYKIFRDGRSIFFYSLSDIAFIPLQVLINTLVIEVLLEKRAKKQFKEKLNMLMGIFFNELGFKLMKLCSNADKNHDKETLEITEKDAIAVYELLHEKKDMILNLITNPTLMEHEYFTELLLATSHLHDELAFRIKTEKLGKEDLEHIKIDMERVYKILCYELDCFMIYLEKNYPFLYNSAREWQER